MLIRYIYNRSRMILSGEDGMVMLEAAIVIAAVCILTASLLQLFDSTLDFAILRSTNTSYTGWFRSSDVDGILETTGP